MCPVEAGGHRDPGGQAANLGCGRLSGTLPFPASESEEGTQAGLQSCRFYQLLTREERRKSEYKQPPPTHPAQMQIFLFSIGGVLVGPNPHFLPASPQSPTAGPLCGDCCISQNAAGHRDPRLFPSLPVAQTIHSPSPGFSLPELVSTPPHSPLPESGLLDSASWRADRWKCLLSAMLGLSVHL